VLPRRLGPNQGVLLLGTSQACGVLGFCRPVSDSTEHPVNRLPHVGVELKPSEGEKHARENPPDSGVVPELSTWSREVRPEQGSGVTPWNPRMRDPARRSDGNYARRGGLTDPLTTAAGAGRPLRHHVGCGFSPGLAGMLGKDAGSLPRDSHGTGGPARAGGRTSDGPPPRLGSPANPGPSSASQNFVFPLPFPSCQPAATSRGSLLTRGTTHRGPSPPRQPWASEPCLLAQPQPALPRVGSRPLPRGKPCASRGVDRPSKACATGISLHHLCEPRGPGGRGCPESGHPAQKLDRPYPAHPAPCCLETPQQRAGWVAQATAPASLRGGVQGGPAWADLRVAPRPGARSLPPPQPSL
jgi:hypothetical protein